MSELFEDLRFFIGSFFFILAVLLIVQNFVEPSQVEGLNVNLYAGLGFLVFSFGAFVLTYLAWSERRRGRAIGETPIAMRKGS